MNESSTNPDENPWSQFEALAENQPSAASVQGLGHRALEMVGGALVAESTPTMVKERSQLRIVLLRIVVENMVEPECI